MIYVGIDWAEGHNDVCVEGLEGHVLAKGLPEGIERNGCIVGQCLLLVPD